MASVLAAGSAVAADSDTGTITFHGMVSNNTCRLLDQKINQDGNDFDVTLDTVFVRDFANALGSTSTTGEKKFSLSLTGCDTATVKKASAQFSSGLDPLLPKAVCWFHQAMLRVQLRTLTWCCQTTVTQLPIRSKLTRLTTPRKQPSMELLAQETCTTA